MIQVPKFQFKLKSKSKAPASKGNRWIKLCIDTTTGLLIVAIFFYSRHLRRLMPDAPATPVKHMAPIAAVDSNATTTATSPALASSTSLAPAAPAPNAYAPPAPATSVAAAPVTASTAGFGAAEVPGASNNAAANMGGWISSAPKQPAVASPASQVSGNPGQGMAMSSAPAMTQTVQPGSQPVPAAGALRSFDQSASSTDERPVITASAPVSLGDSFMAALSPSAKGETIQTEMQPAKTLAQPMTVSAARQPLRVSAPAKHEAAPLTEDQKLSLAAQDDFEHVLDMAKANPDVFGFLPSDKMDQSKLGDPIRVYTISETDQKNYQPGQPLKPILKPTDEWIFPAMLNNRVRFMIPVRRVDGEYSAETSSRALAMVYEKIQARWPASQGFHPALVVNGNFANYYFTVPELPNQNLTDTSAMFEFNPTLSPASVVLASWQ